jgi:hypothetical protein
MSDMFQQVDSKLEAAIVADTPKRKRGSDFSVRTVTHWLSELVREQHFGYCTIPTHYDNVPDSDFSGEKFDKYPTRLCVTIDPYEVCRWCYIAEADVACSEAGLPPTERVDENAPRH